MVAICGNAETEPGLQANWRFSMRYKMIHGGAGRKPFVNAGLRIVVTGLTFCSS
jgi:hypothetical protein